MVALVDFSNLATSEHILKKMIQLTEESNPFFKATAIISSEIAGKNMAHSVISHFGRVNMKIFDDVLQAKDWLVTQ